MFPEVARFSIAVESGILEVGIQLGEHLRDENRGDVVRALIRDRNRCRIASDVHCPVRTLGLSGLPLGMTMMDTVPSVWLAT